MQYNSTIYDEQGDFIHIKDGRNEFTKMTTDINELSIYNILHTSGTKSCGIVNIIQLSNNFVKLENLDTSLNHCTMADIKHKMKTVKAFLQNLGIMYIDWKRDNIGIGRLDGELKLFDFDVSGIIDLHTNEWLLPPPKCWAYRDAINAGMITPKEIDDYAFNKGFTSKINI